MIAPWLLVLIVLSFGSVQFPSPVHAQQRWQAQWDKTLNAAEQEGRVTYSGCGSHDYLAEFQKKFTKIKLESVSAPCAELTVRIMAERRAGKYLHDVVRLGITSAHNFYRAKVLQPINSTLILPEVIDPSKWWQKKHHYSDAEGRFLFVPAASVYTRFASYNAALVNPAEFKSYWDLLEPKWKGKFVASEMKQGEGRNGARLIYYHPELGPSYLRRLYGEMELTFSRDYRQATDWLAQKRFAIYLFSQSDDTLNAKEQGLPVQILDTSGWKEGVGLDAIGGAYSLMDNPAHPNAAKILINWLLSRDGQIALQRDHEAAGRTDSLRIDIPKTDVHPMMRRRDGINYLMTWNPEWQDMRPVQNLINQALSEGKKN
ncbi:MAG TPA: extracellular solute-binding protein [Candidatus Binatus sp.]|nr:extracellular solute-binding protein [Candidatus Binatus sp.]